MPDMTQDKRRDELFKHMYSLFIGTDINKCINYVLAREKKMLSEIEKPLKEYLERCEFPDDTKDPRDVMSDALATINKYKG